MSVINDMYGNGGYGDFSDDDLNYIPRLNAKVVLLGDYGAVGPTQHIEFDDKCPVCGESELEVKGNRYCSDGEFYWTDNISCKNECKFKYDDLVNLTGFNR